ncbi:MAG TPA: ABC transporter permease [Firmicutes bacterium]|jgi:putative spermidine/putrescine transport system permease protein|nr:ABC transporter permease [Bacillota bacterium]
MRRLANTLFLGPTLLLFGLFFILPMGMLVIFSFQGADGFTLDNYIQILTNPRYSKSLWNSFWLSVVVTAGTLVLSGLIAFFLARTEFKGKNLYMTLITFPASLPGVVVGFMIIVLFGNTGVVPMLTRQITGKAIGSFAYTITGIFFAYLYFMIPKIVMTVHGAVVEFDRRLEEAARTIGANELQALLYVVIPTLAPAFISAAAISFYTSMGAFGTAFTLANQFEILPIIMYTDFTLNFKIGSASAIAILIGVICVTLNMVSRVLLEKE